MTCKILFVVFVWCISCTSTSNSTKLFDLPEMQTVSLTPVSFIQKEISESSGLVKSRSYPNLYWTHNDSGGKTRLYALRFEDNAQSSIEAVLDLKGVKNQDWEDISIDINGNLYVSDTGNNSQKRKFLHFYVISEKSKTGHAKEYSFRFPDYQKPVKHKNFDCEAMFHFQNKLYVLTKHRDDAKTKLYRFNELIEGKILEPEKLHTFDIGGQVTSADMSQSESQLAVLTYNSVWLFKNFKGDNFFSGDVYFLPISAKQCEAICFDNEEELIITNEQREIFRVAVHDFIKINKRK
ncbi:hypothetical protein PQO03_13210 [Lentisphaera profundi]|uniref:Lipoprotein n=1 Tax=Lentisphaera profundi TaxID=1658616 RepID=A0ABY7VX24_9BACT|nr:hypothetical protein [Lentisphaera profundi]WDE98795.1 hypothetical protein PQO03_13210 [Lentisphaera profundi]